MWIYSQQAKSSFLVFPEHKQTGDFLKVKISLETVTIMPCFN